MTAQVRPPTGGGGAVDSVNGRVGVVVGLAEQVDLAAEEAAREAADTAHEGAADPHPGYLTPAEGAGAFDAIGAATSAVSTHAGLPDPHPGYLTAAEGNAAYDALGAAAAAQAAAIAASQPVDADLTAIAALVTTAYGRAFLALADASAGRTALGLGTAATSNVGDFDAAGAAAAAQAASQPVDSDLTAIAALSTTSFGRSLLALADASAGRTALGLGGSATLAVGTTAGTVAAGDDSRITGAAQKASNLSDLANAGTARTNLGLGTAATSAASDFEAVAGHTPNSIPAASGSTSLADLAMGASTILARLAAGDIVAATPAQLKTLLAIAESDVTNLVTDLAGKASTAHATTHQPGGSDAMAVDAAAATGSLRTLGTGATQAMQGSLAAPLASPTFTGTPAAPTAAGGTNTTQVASTAFVQAAVPAPGFKSQRYYSQRNQSGSGTLTADRLLCAPFLVPKATTFDTIAVAINTGGASSAVRLGIYADTGTRYPGSLVVDAGTISTATNGLKGIAISQALPAGLYWLALAAQTGGTPPSIMLETVQDNWVGNVASGFYAFDGSYYQAGVTGALPGTFTSTVNVDVAPHLLLKAT